MYTQQSETPTKKVTRKMAIKSGEKPKHFVVHILLMHQKILGWIMFFGISAKVPAREKTFTLIGAGCAATTKIFRKA